MKIVKWSILAASLSLALVGCASAPATSDAAKPAAMPAASASAGGEVLFDGFEDDPIWTAVAGSWKDGDNSVSAEIVEKNATQGKYALLGKYKFANADKGATFMTEGPDMKNWDGVKTVKVDIYNSAATAIELQLAPSTGGDWAWHQTEAVKVNPGLNKDVVFSLTKLASGASDWKYTLTALKDAKLVQRVAFKITSGIPKGAEGTIYFDNIRLVK